MEGFLIQIEQAIQKKSEEEKEDLKK